MGRELRIAVIGAGIGGLTAALALAQQGFAPHVFEQASELRELGAGLGLGPNAVRIFRALGLEPALLSTGFMPQAVVGRDWTGGQELFRVSVATSNAARFGAPLINIHRADLLEILADACRGRIELHLGSRCTGVVSSDRMATLAFDDGTHASFDLVVGCDGIHSSVREAIVGPRMSQFTGNICWRALVAAESLPPELMTADVTLWSGPGGHVVTYYVRGGALINVVAIRETAHWAEESWSISAPDGELIGAFPSVHPDLKLILSRVDTCYRWGLFDREPLPRWSAGRITLLGDAAHPMLPFVGQGAAMAIEDAFVLARELARSCDLGAALRAYEAERIPRATRVQAAARAQASILHRANGPVRFDAGWLYEYDPTSEACA
jgi:salicylate hydroxylase